MTLLELVYLGEWTANSSESTTTKEDPYAVMLSYLGSFAKDFGCEEQVEYSTEDGFYYPTREFEDRLQPLIDHNHNDVFWNELALRLARRDLDKKGLTYPSQEDYLKDLFEIEERYETEFDQHGLDNLVVNKEKS